MADVKIYPVTRLDKTTCLMVEVGDHLEAVEQMQKVIILLNSGHTIEVDNTGVRQ